MARRAARSGALWGLIFGFFIIVQTHAYTSTYKTQASRDQLARAYGSNTAMNALLGSERAVNTVAGFASWRFVGILSILGSIWGLLTSTRLMRGEEEAGRYDLLLAGQTTRRRAGGQALAGLGAGLLALFVLTALGAIVTGRSPSVGFSLGQCLYFSVTLVAGAAMFLAIGALASQLASTRRRAAAMAGVVFGVAYALRMVADTNQGLHWLVWLSPLGWVEETRPLTDPNPVALLPVLVLLIAVTAATLHLAGTRDVGAASLPGRDSSRPHLALLGGSAGLAVRLMRPVALGWLFAVAAFAVLIGTTAESSAKDATGSQGIQQAIGRLGGHGSLVADDLGLDVPDPRAPDRADLGRPDHRDADRGGRRLPGEPPCPSGEPDVVVRRTAGTVLPSPAHGWPAGRDRGLGGRRQPAQRGPFRVAGDGRPEHRPAGALPPRPRRAGARRVAAADLGSCLRIPGLVVSRRVRGRRGSHQPLATGHIRLLPHGSRPRRQSRLAGHGGHHRPRDPGSRPRRHPSLPSRPEERMTWCAPGLARRDAGYVRARRRGGVIRDRPYLKRAVRPGLRISDLQALHAEQHRHRILDHDARGFLMILILW